MSPPSKTETQKLRSGFTLVELLVVTSILSVLLSALYLSFQTGLAAYVRSEEHLIEGREGEIFSLQLEEELRHAIPYFLSPFVGDRDSLAFPTRLRHYSPKGVEEDLYLVEYQVKSGSLIRSERKMKKSLKEKTELKETLFKRLEICQFDFLYLSAADKLEWDKEWTNKPYVGLPRGVRITLVGDVFGKEKRVLEILIPHGILLKRLQ